MRLPATAAVVVSIEGNQFTGSIPQGWGTNGYYFNGTHPGSGVARLREQPASSIPQATCPALLAAAATKLPSNSNLPGTYNETQALEYL